MKKVIDKIGISGATLKWIAILTMLLNHLCFALTNKGVTDYFVNTANHYLTRGALVIFCFLISEGFYYTRNKVKYIFSIFAFAIVAEIPFDLCIFNTVINMGYQNVLWTLGIGALALVGIDYFERKPIQTIIVSIIAMSGSLYLACDASFIGVGMVIVFYYFRDVKWKRLLFSFIAYILLIMFYFWHFNTPTLASFPDTLANTGIWGSIYLEWHGLVAWPFLLLYNGKKGKNINKWFFYGFYPGHLLIIYLVVSLFLGF